MRLFILLPILLLGGCASTLQLQNAGLPAICTALIGPIKYNTYNKESARYAAPSLAPDLRARNKVGLDLGCPQYRSR